MVTNVTQLISEINSYVQPAVDIGAAILVFVLGRYVMMAIIAAGHRRDADFDQDEPRENWERHWDSPWEGD
jgi:hypothetical protein